MKMTAEGIYTVLIQEEKKRGPQAKLPMSRKTKEELVSNSNIDISVREDVKCHSPSIICLLQVLKLDWKLTALLN